MSTPFPELDERYRVLEELGGGQGIVLHAVEIETGRHVAVKTANEVTASDPERLRRFVESLRRLNEIRDEHVLSVLRFHDVGELSDRAFLVTDWVDQTLEEKAASGTLDFATSLEVVQKILKGLSAIHRAGLIHRDLRPANIYVSDDCQEVRIGDLGGEEGTLGNSTKYTAPEAYDESAVVDTRSDIYSAGLIAYELLLGRERFEEQFPDIYGAEEERVQLSRWINWHRDGSRAAPPLFEVDPGIPQSVSDAIASMLAKDPNERYFDAELALNSVSGTVQGGAGSAIPILRIEDGDETEESRGGTRSWWIAAAIVLLIAAAGIGALWFSARLSGNQIRAANEAMEAMEAARREAIAASAPELAPEEMSAGNANRSTGHDAYQAEDWGVAVARFVDAREDYLDAAERASRTEVVMVGGRKYAKDERGIIEIDGRSYRVDENGQLVEVDPETGEVVGTPGLVEIDGRTFRVGEDGELIEVDPETGEPLGTRMVLLGSTEEEIDLALELCEEYGALCDRSWYETEIPREYAPRPLEIDPREVTNAQFAAFVHETGHVTDAERAGFASKWVGIGSVMVEGVSWRAPDGVGSTFADRLEHPVRVISRSDADAYCRWSGGRLPTEDEWEFAARGPERRVFPWGDSFEPGRALWFGDRGGAPATREAGSFPDGATPEGILDLAGSVWEWTSTRSPDGYILKGGSFEDENPANLRAAARRESAPDAPHVDDGFRCVSDPG